MKSFTAVTLLGMALFLEMLAGTQLGCLPELPMGILFYFSTIPALPFTLAGAILSGLVLDVLCCRAEPLLLLSYPVALLCGSLIRWRLGDEGRWTALPAGAVLHLILNVALLRAGDPTISWGWPLLFNTAAGAVEVWVIVVLIDLPAKWLKFERYAAPLSRQLNAAPRKHRAPARINRTTSR